MALPLALTWPSLLPTRERRLADADTLTRRAAPLFTGMPARRQQNSLLPSHSPPSYPHIALPLALT